MKARELIDFLNYHPDAEVCVREKDGGQVFEVYNVVLGSGLNSGRVILQFFEGPKRETSFRPW